MSEQDRIDKGDSRREFLRGAGASVIAGGTALMATGLTAEAQAFQTPTVPSKTATDPAAPVAPAAQDPGKPTVRRASGPMNTNVPKLGPLKDLSGTWVGKGFNTISLPDFQNPEGPQPFRVKVNSTIEILEFNKIGGNVPNRGSTGQNDIALFGLTYLQRISNSLTNEPLHIEPGFWLFVPETVVPVQPKTVVRMGSIPHGTTILAQGSFIENNPGGPLIKPVSTIPLKLNPVTMKFEPFPINDPYLDPFQVAIGSLPPGFPSTFLFNPNLALSNDINGQNIIDTTVLIISTEASKDPSGNAILPGSIGNIPFLDKNAKVTQLDAIFWIEKVRPATGDPSGKDDFLQLQYTQTVVLEFLKIKWPHISVATLLKQ